MRDLSDMQNVFARIGIDRSVADTPEQSAKRCCKGSSGTLACGMCLCARSDLADPDAALVATPRSNQQIQHSRQQLLQLAHSKTAQDKASSELGVVVDADGLPYVLDTLQLDLTRQLPADILHMDARVSEHRMLREQAAAALFDMHRSSLRSRHIRLTYCGIVPFMLHICN